VTAFLGIDPGLDGFLCLLIEPSVSAPPQPIFQFWLMPTVKASRGRRVDRLALAEVFRYLPAITLGVIEKAQPGGKQKVGSAFKSGEGYGVLLGCLAMQAIGHEEVTPRAWKKALGLASVGGALKENSKERKEIAIAHARQLFPWVDLRKDDGPDSRCKVPHDGKAEALLLAEYARRRWLGQAGPSPRRGK
jgi:hypothetical protein